MKRIRGLDALVLLDGVRVRHADRRVHPLQHDGVQKRDDGKDDVRGADGCVQVHGFDR